MSCGIYRVQRSIPRALKKILVCDCSGRVDAIDDDVGFEMHEKLIQRGTMKHRLREFIHDIVDVHSPEFRVSENILSVHILQFMSGEHIPPPGKEKILSRFGVNEMNLPITASVTGYPK